MIATPLIYARSRERPVASERGTIVSIRIVINIVIRLLHLQLARSVGSKRLAIVIEAGIAVGILGSYGYLLRRAMASSSDLAVAPRPTLLSYSILIIVVTGTVMTAAVVALTGSNRSGLEAALMPLPVEQGVVRLGLAVVPLSLSYALASVPSLALVSVYVKSVGPEKGITSCLLLSCALITLLIVVLVASGVVHLVGVALSRFGLRNLSMTLASVVVAGVSMALVTFVTQRMSVDEHPWVLVEADRMVDDPLVLVFLAASLAMVTVVVMGLTFRVLAIRPAGQQNNFAFGSHRCSPKRLDSLEFWQLIRHPGVSSTLVLVLIGMGLSMAGSQRVLGIASLEPLSAGAFFLLPFLAVYSYPATCGHHWLYSTTPQGSTKWVPAKTRAVVATVLPPAALLGVVGTTVGGGMTVTDIVEGAPFVILAVVVSLWCGLFSSSDGEDPSSGLLVYLAAVALSAGVGVGLAQSGLLDSSLRMVGSITLMVASLRVYQPAALAMERRRSG